MKQTNADDRSRPLGGAKPKAETDRETLNQASTSSGEAAESLDRQQTGGSMGRGGI